nr:hypothetical protein [Tanacetum cinerariifolium]
KEQESETITEVVEIPSSQSTPLVPPPKTPPLFTPKPKENLKPNPHQPLIPYPSWLKEEKFQALENRTRRADHFIYRIDIVDKIPIEKNSMSGNPTPSSDSVVESLSLLPTPFEDSDPLMEENDTLLSHLDNSPPEYETFSFDIEEKSSGSTTSQSGYSLMDYGAFYFDDDYIEEESSGCTITHSNFSFLEYDSFIFDLSIDPFLPADRSDFYHEEFAVELAHIISPPDLNPFVEISSGKSKVYIEVLSVLWGNRLPIRTVRARCLASTSHNVFNERLEDAYFNVSTSFHDLSNVHTFYQPYPHEKKCTKDHPLHKIIGDPKSSIYTKGQLANPCLFSCLQCSIEPANVAEALRDVDWVSAMQDELDQFARLKVWRLVPRPEGKTIIKTKWIFKNKKDESCLFIRNKARLVAVGYSKQ